MTVGWDPALATSLLDSAGRLAEIEFLHALVDEPNSIQETRAQFPQAQFIPLAPARDEPLPEPDFDLLASLEGPGVPTFRSMIFGDPYLRHRPYRYGLSYATLLAERLTQLVKDRKPKFLVASNDRLHSGVALAVARSQDVPFVVMSFSVIPTGRTALARALVPDALLPLEDPDAGAVRSLAEQTRTRFINGDYVAPAYKAPFTIRDQLLRVSESAKRFTGRLSKTGIPESGTFRNVSFRTGMHGIVRRGWNRAMLPTIETARTAPSQRYILHVLQMSPESYVDTWAPWYRDQMNLVKQVAIATPADCVLVVKPHFSDPDNYGRHEYKELTNMGVRIAHPLANTRDLIEGAALVSAISSTATLEAALLGKPVLLFADSPYKRFPASRVSRGPGHLAAEISELLHMPVPTEDSILEAYTEYLSRYLPGLSNKDWSVPVTDAETERMGNILSRLVGYINQPTRTSWYSHFPFDIRGMDW